MCFEVAKMTKQRLDSAIDTVLTEPSKGVVCPEKDFTRDRVFTLRKMVDIILGMGGQSLNKELYAYFNKYGIVDERTAKKSAFVQQRAKIKPELFYDIFQAFNDVTPHENDLFKGYRLYAVDGSDVYISHNPDSETYLRNNTDTGYNNLFHVNALYNLLSHTYEDITIVPRKTNSERAEMLKMVKRIRYNGKILVIMDRGYDGLNIYENLNRMENVDYLICVKNEGLSELKELPYQELDKDITVHVRTGQSKEDKALYKAGKAKFVSGHNRHKGKYSEIIWDFESVCDVSFRVLRIKINDTGVDSKDYETIITSLDRKDFPLSLIKKLYHMRWGIETSFRDLKYAVGLVNFHAKNEEFIKQEIIARAVVVVRQIVNKWTYAVNFTMAIYLCIDYFRHRGNELPDVVREIEGYTEPVRKGRADKRKFRVKQPVWFMYRVA